MKKLFKKLAGIVTATAIAVSLLAGAGAGQASAQISMFKEPPFEAYKVDRGDTFYFIAKRYGLDYKKLMELNPTVDPKNMQVGSIIRLKPKAGTSTTPSTSTNSVISAYEKQVADLVNAERKKAGLKPLILDTKLSEVAGIKSADMQKRGQMSHTGTYGDPFQMMKHFGITYKSAGENIAQGQRTPQEVMNAWMNSQGHRANILNPSFTHIGVGHVANGNYWTQQFIGK
jgi:uncharacterized YkwD family protein